MPCTWPLSFYLVLWCVRYCAVQTKPGYGRACPHETLKMGLRLGVCMMQRMAMRMTLHVANE